MLYAKYKTRNLQGVLGPGGAGNSPATTTGSSNATGGADTKNESSKYVCGVAYAEAAYDASDMDASYGSRLAFHGTISELDPRQFKRLPVL